MPFQSETQRRYLWSQKPEVARKMHEHAKFVLPGNAMKRPRLVIPDHKDPKPGLAPTRRVFAAAYSVEFDKSVFPAPSQARDWVNMHGKANGVRMASLYNAGEAWGMRQGAPRGDRRIKVAPGVCVVVPKPMKKGIVTIMELKKAASPLPVMPMTGAGYVRGAVGPGSTTPAMPNWYEIYFSPEAEKRQAKESEQSDDRRRAGYRDFSTTGMHGTPPGVGPSVRYLPGETATADMATRANREYLTAEEIQANQKRIQQGAVIGYEMVQGKPNPSKKGKVRSR